MIGSRLAVVSFVALALAGTSLAAENMMLAPEQLQKIMVVREVRARPDQVSGVLVNLSSKPVRNVQVRIARSWLWKNERHPGENEDNPGRSVVYAVPGEIPSGGPHGLHLSARHAPPGAERRAIRDVCRGRRPGAGRLRAQVRRR